MKNLQKKLLQLRAYYAIVSKKSNVHSNFFLIGYRKKFIFLRLQAVVSQLKRMHSFFLLNRGSRMEVWFISMVGGYRRLFWWMSRYVRFNFILRVDGGVFVIWWLGRCFVARIREFNNRMVQFVGIDVALVFGERVPAFALSLSAKGVPILSFMSPNSQMPSCNLFFVCSPHQPKLLMVYSRLLSIFLRQ